MKTIAILLATICGTISCRKQSNAPTSYKCECSYYLGNGSGQTVSHFFSYTGVTYEQAKKQCADNYPSTYGYIHCGLTY